MATTHRSDLTTEIEKALTDEAYDGGMGAMSEAEFPRYVRRLVEAAAEVAYRNELARVIRAQLLGISPFCADIERRLAGERAVRDCVAEHFDPVAMIAYRSPSEGVPPLPRFSYPEGGTGV